MDEKTEFQHESYSDDLPKQIEQFDDTYDAHDPLNWGGLRKLSVLIVTVIWTLLGTSNMIVAGPTHFPVNEDLSVPIALTTYSIGGPLLAYGVASIIWVAFGNRFGVRLSFVETATIAGCLCLWDTKATSFGELVAATTLSSLFLPARRR
jgi:hypothetical protein